MIKSGRRILYRPLTPHWEGQLHKFLDRRHLQTLDDVVPLLGFAHIMRTIEGKTSTDRSGRVNPLTVKVGTFYIKDVSDTAIDGELRRQWVVVLGDRLVGT